MAHQGDVAAVDIRKQIGASSYRPRRGVAQEGREVPIPRSAEGLDEGEQIDGRLTEVVAQDPQVGDVQEGGTRGIVQPVRGEIELALRKLRVVHQIPHPVTVGHEVDRRGGDSARREGVRDGEEEVAVRQQPVLEDHHRRRLARKEGGVGETEGEGDGAHRVVEDPVTVVVVEIPLLPLVITRWEGPLYHRGDVAGGNAGRIVETEGNVRRGRIEGRCGKTREEVQGDRRPIHQGRVHRRGDRAHTEERRVRPCHRGRDRGQVTGERLGGVGDHHRHVVAGDRCREDTEAGEGLLQKAEEGRVALADRLQTAELDDLLHRQICNTFSRREEEAAEDRRVNRGDRAGGRIDVHEGPGRPQEGGGGGGNHRLAGSTRRPGAEGDQIGGVLVQRHHRGHHQVRGAITGGAEGGIRVAAGHGDRRPLAEVGVLGDIHDDQGIREALPIHWLVKGEEDWRRRGEAVEAIRRRRQGVVRRELEGRGPLLHQIVGKGKDQGRRIKASGGDRRRRLGPYPGAGAVLHHVAGGGRQGEQKDEG